MRFNTFDQVAKWYNDTKPVRGSVHKRKDDIRPIGKRKRTWERIMKVDANSYLLLDGNWVYPDGHGQATLAMAPIVWTRTQCGDYIRLRSGVASRTNISSRYEFLRYHTPTDMQMIHGNGRLSFRVKTAQGREEFPLPKCAFEYDYSHKKLAHADDMFLTFRVNGDGTYTRVGTLLYETARIDKDLKRELKPHIASFYEFLSAVAPMLDTSGGAMREYREQLQPKQGARVPVALARTIVSQEDHELRVALAAIVAARCHLHIPIRNERDVRNAKAAYNLTMNTLLGLYTVVQC